MLSNQQMSQSHKQGPLHESKVIIPCGHPHKPCFQTYIVIIIHVKMIEKENFSSNNTKAKRLQHQISKSLFPSMYITIFHSLANKVFYILLKPTCPVALWIAIDSKICSNIKSKGQQDIDGFFCSTLQAIATCILQDYISTY